MIICPWCGTNYLTFQSNCTNCGGPLQAVQETAGTPHSSEVLPTPPPAPRPISNRYIWRLLSTDGWSIGALVFGILGFIFSLVGGGLTIGIITAFIGIPFLVLGLGFLIAGGAVLYRRYQEMQQVVEVLRNGEATLGQIVEVKVNYSVAVNGRNPWNIRYQFQVNGGKQEGQVTTLNQPGPQLQEGKDVRVLYLPAAPKWSSIYPHP
jgi:hypothetical protein